MFFAPHSVPLSCLPSLFFYSCSLLQGVLVAFKNRSTLFIIIGLLKEFGLLYRL